LVISQGYGFCCIFRFMGTSLGYYDYDGADSLHFIR
jgi:hypothetical protein